MVVASYAAKWIKAHVSQMQVDLAIDIGRVARAAVEQLAASQQIDVQEKVQKAVMLARNQAAKYGLIFTDDEWKGLIDAAGKAMKDTGNEVKQAAPSTANP